MKTGALFEKVEKIKMPIRIAIFLGTLVLLAGLFIYFVYLPYSEEIAKSRDEIAKLQQKLNQAVVRARALKKFEAEYAEVDAQFQEALKLLPNTKEIPSLLKSITSSARIPSWSFSISALRGKGRRTFSWRSRCPLR